MKSAQPTYVVYHGGCNDGFGSAWAAHKKLGDDASYHGVYWGSPLPEFPEIGTIYFCDYCPPRAELERLVNDGHDVTLLDHHKTAIPQVEGLDRVHKVLDMERSGAVITWEYFFPGEAVPVLFQWIQDRDIWTNKIPEARLATEALRIYPQEFGLWDGFVENPAQLIAAGVVLDERKKQYIESHLDRVYMSEIGGHIVPTINTDSYPSDLGNRLCKEYPDAAFSATWFMRGNGTRKFSLRSIGEFDVAAVAVKFGGGGHRNAAGFVVP